jgi:phage shock protein A
MPHFFLLAEKQNLCYNNVGGRNMYGLGDVISEYAEDEKKLKAKVEKLRKKIKLLKKENEELKAELKAYK